MLPSEWVGQGITIIQFASTLIIVGYVVVACVALVRQPNMDGLRRARHHLTEGALLGLSLIVAATLLRTIVVRTFTEIGMFAAIFALRTLIKRTFTAESRRM
jgi:uncharacterized membrane protein